MASQRSTISREHCVISFVDAGAGKIKATIRDNSSSNGTFHNGVKLGKESIELRPGDMLVFGPPRGRRMQAGEEANFKSGEENANNLVYLVESISFPSIPSPVSAVSDASLSSSRKRSLPPDHTDGVADMMSDEAAGAEASSDSLNTEVDAGGACKVPRTSSAEEERLRQDQQMALLALQTETAELKLRLQQEEATKRQLADDLEQRARDVQGIGGSG
jgi:hypothetical protein